MKMVQTIALMLTSGLAAHAQTPSAPVQVDRVVVRGERLSASALAGATLILERPRDNQIKIEMDGDGRFRSYLGGRLHDRGRWRVEGELVCFDATKPGESSCASGIVGKRPGDEWDMLGLGGNQYRARLVAGT